jgi:adenylate cyclase
MTETRKIAAILAADVVGYSRLAGADEDRTLARLRALRSDLIDPTIAVHNGRVVKRTGDGILIEFRSVVDAVRCAIEIQNAMVERNEGVAEDRRIEFRVGIHLGDIVEECDGDLMGDGVNIAARLEGIAKPGAICLSEDAYRQVSGRLDMKVTDLGPTQLKNIDRSIRAYSLQVGIPAKPKPAQESHPAALAAKPRGLLSRWPSVAAFLVVAALAAGAYAWRSGLASRVAGSPVAEDKLASSPRLSIVVLPFDNLSSDPEQDYFADAITDDLTTDLSHLSDSFVIARNTAYTYKGKAVDVKQIGRDLGVRYLLEGSARRIGETIAVNAQLISTETGAHIWADRFDGDRARLGQLQVEFVARLANLLGVELVKAETLRATRERPDNPDAVDLAMRGRVASFRVGPAGLNEAIDYYERALKLDPENVRAQIGVAHALASRINNGWSADPKADVDRAERFANEALSRQPENAFAHYAKGLVYGDKRQWDAAIAEAIAATDNDRNFAPAYALGGADRMFIGLAAEGFSSVETAIKLSPHDPTRPFWDFDICHLHSHLAQWEEAIEPCRRAIQAIPNLWYPYVDLVAAYTFLGAMPRRRPRAPNF